MLILRLCVHIKLTSTARAITIAASVRYMQTNSPVFAIDEWVCAAHKKTFTTMNKLTLQQTKIKKKNYEEGEGEEARHIQYEAQLRVSQQIPNQNKQKLCTHTHARARRQKCPSISSLSWRLISTSLSSSTVRGCCCWRIQFTVSPHRKMSMCARMKMPNWALSVRASRDFHRIRWHFKFSFTFRLVVKPYYALLAQVYRLLD